MAEQWGGCSGETLRSPCAIKGKLPRKMTEDYCQRGAEENIGVFSKSCNDGNSFMYLSLLKDKLGLFSINRFIIYLQSECIEHYQFELCSKYDREYGFDVMV